MNGAVQVPNDQPIITFIFWIVVACAGAIAYNYIINKRR